MFGGIIKHKEGKMVPGTLRQWDYSDTYQYSLPIEYDGELTPEVCTAIQNAWESWNRRQPRESSWGRLRWDGGSSFSHVDIENRCVIINGCTMLAD